MKRAIVPQVAGGTEAGKWWLIEKNIVAFSFSWDTAEASWPQKCGWAFDGTEGRSLRGFQGKGRIFLVFKEAVESGGTEFPGLATAFF